MERDDPQRPVFLNLLHIRLPVTGITSILHRISGVLLFLAIPLGLLLLERSLADPGGFAEVAGWLETPAARVLGVVLGWAVAHHMLAGVRFLLIDLRIGIERAGARRGAWLVNIGAAVVVVIGAVALWLGGAP